MQRFISFNSSVIYVCCFFFFQAEDGIRDLVRSRGLGDVYKRQHRDSESPRRSPVEFSRGRRLPLLNTTLAVLSVISLCICIAVLGMQIKLVTNKHHTPDITENDSVGSVLQPPLPGILQGSLRPRLILAQGIDFPPYAYLATPPGGDHTVSGFGVDFAKGMGKECGIDITLVQTDWDQCWDGNQIGSGLLNGHFHACMTYTHTLGARDRYVEFSSGILARNKPFGVITRLRADGTPEISAHSNLNGLKVADVTGWAPGRNDLARCMNSCTDQPFTGYTMVDSTPSTGGSRNPNDDAITMLMNREVDAIWAYSDQAHNYLCERAHARGVIPDWNCTKWTGFGTDFAYIQTGLAGDLYNGTTLTISKRGSGIPAIVNPCLQSFLLTKEYYNICAVSYTHLRAHETVLDLVCRLLLEKKKNNKHK
eukprot:TRINITY_DN436_c0_g1_i8.p1 TRINITY_DN436_c0_g1~~TRINITY_DN436_c0_g1_i8.p1  ORF type:complete len:423 (-),score=82.75 TRINITY_DN436_c0_g1_i8:81-1349(-)